MTLRQLQRAELFSVFTEKPILFIENMFGDGVMHWFICNSFTPYDPSSHIHYNNLISGICIDNEMSNPMEFDKMTLITKLTEIKPSSITFSKDIKWVKIK